MTRRVRTILGAGLIGCGLIWASADGHHERRLIYNTTASIPIGFYWLDPIAPEVGDLAVVRPPRELALWMAGRRYLPLNVPLLKRVAAIGGMRVCGRGGVISIDGVVVGAALPRDRWGRRLDVFAACRPLRADELFLFNPAALESLDSRYFGPVRRDRVLGRARPLWTWER